jgi:hypothetical protein
VIQLFLFDFTRSGDIVLANKGIVAIHLLLGIEDVTAYK